MRNERTPIEIEALLIWTFRDELSKRQTSAAEGLWDHIRDDGQAGTGIDHGQSSAQRYAFVGLPDPDAIRVEKAVGALEDMAIDWRKSFEAIAGDIAGLVSLGDVTGRKLRPRTPKGGFGMAGRKALKAWFGPDDVEPDRARQRSEPSIGALRTAALVTMHSVRGTRPDWIEDSPRPLAVPALRGTNAMIRGTCHGRNLYSLGSCCPLEWSPAPMSILWSRAEYVAWHHGLTELARTVETDKFTVMPPRALQTPWLGNAGPIAGLKPVMPAPGNQVRAWGTLPLTPHRDRKGPPLRSAKGGPVTYPLRGAGQ